MVFKITYFLIGLSYVWALPMAYGQVVPASNSSADVLIAQIEIEGVENENTKDFLKRASGLYKGQKVTLPDDPVFAVAIRSIYRIGQFSNVKIAKEELSDKQIKVIIGVQSFPRLNELSFDGIDKKDQKQVKQRLWLPENAIVRQADIEQAEQVIVNYFQQKGYPLAKASVTQSPLPDNRIDLEFAVKLGARLKIVDVDIVGAEHVSEKSIKKKLQTREKAWWRVWDKARFDENVFNEDKNRVLGMLHEKGFYDARIVRDTVYQKVTEDNAGVYVEIEVDEGNPFYVRNVSWEGNTLFSDEELNKVLGIEAGDRYNLLKLESNLYANERGNDIAGLYMNQGYMRFNIEPQIKVIGNDSLDLVIHMFEGNVYTFGEIEIAGNDITHDHVIRRELYSIPGAQFSRAAIQESIRRLMQTGYFSDYSVSQGPNISIDEERKRVNLRYELEEASFPRPQITGSIGQFGLVLGVNVSYNNFSLQKAFSKGGWKPVPSGDGQFIGLNVQASARAYQQYGFSFTEPWFRGKPAPLGFSTSYSHIGADAISSDLTGSFNTFSGRVFHDRRLKWPSSFFSSGTAIEYRTFDNTLYDSLPRGVNRQLEITQQITRNTRDHPVFAAQGSYNSLSVEIGVPVSDFVQYHKWRFQSGWNFPLLKNRRLSINVGADLGYLGSLTGDPVAFERFVLGGSPLDAQGIGNTPVLGTEVIYFRGYPLGSIGASGQSDTIGQRALTKFTSELRWMMIRNAPTQIQVMPYLFYDAANTWDTLSDINTKDLFRSAGLGMRMTIPVLGIVELAYGRNLNRFTPPEGSSHTGNRDWRFQFAIGRGFNF